MSATNALGHAVHCLQLVAALDRYFSRLDELDSSKPEQIAHHLTHLTESVRQVRVVCAAFPGLQSLLFELLIGHSELVSKVVQRPKRSDGRNTRSTLVAAQRRRAATLLPEIHAPNPFSVAANPARSPLARIARTRPSSGTRSASSNSAMRNMPAQPGPLRAGPSAHAATAGSSKRS